MHPTFSTFMVFWHLYTEKESTIEVTTSQQGSLVTPYQH